MNIQDRMPDSPQNLYEMVYPLGNAREDNGSGHSAAR